MFHLVTRPNGAKSADFRFRSGRWDYIDRNVNHRSSNLWETPKMMTDAEVQLVIYLEALLRQRGYADAARTLAGVAGREFDRREHLSAVSELEWRATG